MSTINQIETYDIASHYGTYIMYSDNSGLDDDEIEQVEAYLQSAVYAEGYQIDCSDEAEEYVATCDISGLLAQCTKFVVYQVQD